MVTLGNRLDNNTLETFTLAEQLNTNLTELNIRIEGNILFYQCLVNLSLNDELVLLERAM